jgi:hypothetical protein
MAPESLNKGDRVDVHYKATLGKQVPAEINKHAAMEGLPFICNGEVNTTV